MPADKSYKVQLIESRESPREFDEREGAAIADLEPSPEIVLHTLQLTSGGKDLIKQHPSLENLALWSQIAHFRVCSKTGTARYLDIWDADHFDGFTDMQRNVSECRVWFSGDGYTTWGSGQTKSGRVNCYFTAPSAGNYICTASLQSFPTSSQARVECLIDNSSFGPLPFTGTIHQPHPTSLSAGGHHFRIRQQSGSFFFLSLTVWKV